MLRYTDILKKLVCSYKTLKSLLNSVKLPLVEKSRLLILLLYILTLSYNLYSLECKEGFSKKTVNISYPL